MESVSWTQYSKKAANSPVQTKKGIRSGGFGEKGKGEYTVRAFENKVAVVTGGAKCIGI